MRRIVAFNYNSKFWKDIVKTINRYNSLFPKNSLLLDMYNAIKFPLESLAGPADMIIHSGGDGLPVKEDSVNIPKLYICYSHQWKAQMEGGKVAPLRDFVNGIHKIDLLRDDEILGKRGKMPIMKHHFFGVVRPPDSAEVLATSRSYDANGREIEIIEALRYPDGSISIQGHPEEGTAAHIFYNLFWFYA